MKNPLENPILGVEVKSLVTHPDDRGFFREVLRHTDSLFRTNDNSPPFGQWSHSKMTKDVVKAWHYHHRQIDWWYVALGSVKTVLYDNRSESPTFGQKMEIEMGESSLGAQEVVVKIPQGVLHGLRVVSDIAHLFYITSHTYDPNDEGRFPYNSEEIPHDWGEGAVTVENDRRRFEPTYERSVVS